MRLWSLSPAYLDSKGLGACWREGLLGMAVLRGETKGYRNHPQISRFPRLYYLNEYLHWIVDEADRRGYKYDRRKLHGNRRGKLKMKVTAGQLDYEMAHLLKKLKVRDPMRYSAIDHTVDVVIPHPMFVVKDGPVELWERIRA